MANNKTLSLFLISPVLGIWEAFKNLKNKQSIVVLFLFCLCFGICFSVGTDRYEGSTDGVAMRIEFEESKNLTGEQYIDFLSDYFKFDYGAQDIYIETVSFLVGRVTKNYHIFFLALAFIFAFFQLKCLKYFVKEENFTNSFICILLTCLFLWNCIYNINGARFWTAAWIGLFCVFKVFHENKPIYMILSGCTLLIHASFAVFPIIMLLAYVTKKLSSVWLVLFCLSWVFSIFAQDFQINLFGNIELPAAIGRKVEFYSDREYIESLSEGSGFFWVSLFFRLLSRHYIELIILLIALNKKRINDERSYSVVGMMIALATLANFAMIIPTFSGRLFVLNYALVAYSFLVTFGDKKYRLLVYLLPFVWFMNLYNLIIHIMAVLDLGFLLSPIISFVRFAFV